MFFPNLHQIWKVDTLINFEGQGQLHRDERNCYCGFVVV